MSLLSRFTQFIKDENLFQPKDKLLLAVSGGLDSVVLCELCQQAGLTFSIAHCNFKLRGAESERDAAFVQSLAKKYNVDFFLKEFDTEKYASEKKLSIQEAARALRYEWFYEIIEGRYTGAIHHSPFTIHQYIATAHHADDNIETMLMNFFRGTGIKGLRGMLSKQGRIVRPLLHFQKKELKEFAEQHQLSWVEDSSNALDKYSRNYFRHQVIPLVQNIYPKTEQNLLENLKRFADIELLYQQSIDQHKKKLLEFKGSEIHIPVLKLKKSQPLHTIIYETILPYGFTATQVNETIDLLDSDTGKYLQSDTHRIIKNRNWIIISPHETKQAEHILIEDGIRDVEFEIGNLKIEHLPNSQSSIPNSSTVACLDGGKIHFPLLLRKWKQGDYFYPLGMMKKKKLSRFFIDQKLSLTDKEKVWVIEMDKKIIWVVGMRIDERFKIGENTKNVLKIEFRN